jgi:hypothetical protein
MTLRELSPSFEGVTNGKLGPFRAAWPEAGPASANLNRFFTAFAKSYAVGSGVQIAFMIR